MRVELHGNKAAADDPASPLYEEDDYEEDDLRAAQGIIVALLVMAPFWGLVGFGVWLLVG